MQKKLFAILIEYNPMFHLDIDSMDDKILVLRNEGFQQFKGWKNGIQGMVGAIP